MSNSSHFIVTISKKAYLKQVFSANIYIFFQRTAKSWFHEIEAQTVLEDIKKLTSSLLTYLLGRGSGVLENYASPKIPVLQSPYVIDTKRTSVFFITNVEFVLVVIYFIIDTLSG